MPNIPRFVTTEDRSFVRDTSNMALLSTDRSALERSRQRRSKSQAQHAEIRRLQSDVEELKLVVSQLLNHHDH